MAEPKTTQEHRYYLLVPLLTAPSVDRAIAVLVKRGYKVGPLSSNRTAYLTGEDNAVTILALELTGHVPSDSKDPRGHVYEEVKDVLKVIEAKYLMIWIGDPCMCNWAMGNVKKTDAAVVGIVEPDKKSMN
jgi:hypothetical protein